MAHPTAPGSPIASVEMEQVSDTKTVHYPTIPRPVAEQSAENPGSLPNDDDNSSVDNELDRLAMEMKLQDLAEKLVEQDAYIQTHVDELKEANAKIEDLQGQLASVSSELARVSTERDTFAVQCARLVVNGNSNSPVSPGPSPSKSIKLPDPPLLTDGKDPDFDNWLMAMKQKLDSNADHFNTKKLRLAYIFSRTDGKARKHVAPRLRTDAITPYHDADDVFNHLDTVYGDPNKVINAKIAFRNLYQKNNKFNDFLSEFLHLAAEAGVPQDDWKQEMYSKLTPEMQKITMPESIRDGTFKEYSDYCSKAANRLEIINSRIARVSGRSDRGANIPSSNATGSSTTSATSAPNTRSSATPAQSAGRSSSPRVSTPRTDIDKATMELRTKENLCYECRKPGHVARDCLQRKLAEIKAIKARDANYDDEDIKEIIRLSQPRAKKD